VIDSALKMELWLVLGTWALVAVTLGLAYSTFRVTRTDLRLRLHLQFLDRFDEVRMRGHRKVLAQQLLAAAPHDDIQEDVMNFFEDLGAFLALGHLDDDLLWGTFSFYITRWWSACKDYISEERQKEANDESLFAQFQAMVNHIYDRESKERGKTRAMLEPSASEVHRFLKNEARLI
jgi:hypothetical protein